MFLMTLDFLQDNPHSLQDQQIQVLRCSGCQDAADKSPVPDLANAKSPLCMNPGALLSDGLSWNRKVTLIINIKVLSSPTLFNFIKTFHILIAQCSQISQSSHIAPSKTHPNYRCLNELLLCAVSLCASVDRTNPSLVSFHTVRNTGQSPEFRGPYFQILVNISEKNVLAVIQYF